MKQSRFLATAVVAGLAIVLCSCGSGGGKSKETSGDTSKTKSAQTASEQTPEVASAPKTTNIVIVKHKVANFAKWKAGYDGHDSARRANGLSNYIIARGWNKDSNTVVVVMKADNILKAKEYASSTDLKDVMQKAGVLGTPEITYDELVWNDNSKIDQTNRLMIRHKVTDFNAWKQEFDGDKQARMDAGLVDRGMARSTGDANDVSVVFAVNDMAKAKAFINSKELKDKMTKAGVEGTPSFYFFNIVQMYQ